MLASGSREGLITIFQIPKNHMQSNGHMKKEDVTSVRLDVWNKQLSQSV
jgi:hypothetical protein